MQRPRPLSLGLAAIAFAGWILFILACTNWPAWSPDGKQLVFPYHDQKTNTTGVALYDRQLKTLATIYQTHRKDRLPAGQWSQDGRQILLYQILGDVDSDGIELLSVPVTGKYPIRSWVVTSPIMGGWPPLTEVNGTVYMGMNGVTALDLDSWQSRQESVGAYGMVFFAMGQRVMYMALSGKEESKSDESTPPTQEGTRPQPNEEVEKQKKEPPTPFEFGELDQKDLSRHAWFTTTNQQIAEFTQCAGADLLMEAATDPASERMAFTLTCGDKADAILLFGRSGIKQVIRPKIEGTFWLTNTQWSPDRKTLYAGFYVAGEKEKGQYGIAEVALETEAVRLTPVAKFDVSSDDYHNYLRASLSPDGSMIATSTALINSEDDIDHDDLALYVVDLRDPKRSVTKIHPPNWEAKPPQPAAAAEKKAQ